ncbi:MAG: patatin-like phospholipase family protein [Candidatus Thermofonsia bacterium]|nr:MAG: patatin-like phospholipase family protein [Candidatus Thermofonsia bacterium]
MPNKSRKRALVLSGGGGRGAYHVGVLRFLEEHDWLPDVVVGTSIGAVNGAAIASGHNAYSLWALWQRLRTNDVQKANLNPLEGTYLLDTAPLRETLQKEGWVNFDRINSEDAAVHLRITATEVNSGHLHVFGNSPDVFPSRLEIEPIELDHIIASCSIPVVYPATQLHEHLYWDGATVANTPLGPAIDAGAEEIVVVIMTPWDDDREVIKEPPGNILSSLSYTLEWALLASFQADLKLFRRVNDLVRLQVENARLRAANAALMAQLKGDEFVFDDVNKNGIPDVLEKEFRQLPDPIIVGPKRPIPVDRIIRYTLDGHKELYQMGYEDAKRAWREAGKSVEGEL